MTFDGEWEISVQTPMGPQKSMLSVVHGDGDALTGELRGNGETVAIRDGSIDGDAVAFKADVTKPFGMTIAFTAKVDGDSLAGEAQAGVFPPSPLSGARQ
jgi:hypothetical protein